MRSARQIPLTLIAFALIGIGAATAMTLTNSVIMATVPPNRAGAASAISETAIEFGGALGVAILGTIATAFYRTGLGAVPGIDPVSMDAARDTVGAALTTADTVGGAAGGALATAARTAFTSGVTAAAAIGAGVLLVVSWWAVAGLRSRTR